MAWFYPLVLEHVRGFGLRCSTMSILIGFTKKSTKFQPRIAIKNVTQPTVKEEYQNMLSAALLRLPLPVQIFLQPLCVWNFEAQTHS